MDVLIGWSEFSPAASSIIHLAPFSTPNPPAYGDFSAGRGKLVNGDLAGSITPMDDIDVFKEGLPCGSYKALPWSVLCDWEYV